MVNKGQSVKKGFDKFSLDKSSLDKFIIIFLLIVLLAAGLRLYKLDNRIFHHDEAVNNYYFVQPIIEDNRFDYDAKNFHGPMTYYLSAIPVALFGESIYWLRFMSALFGVLIVAMLYPLRRYLGDIGTIIAALFLAVSPTMVYFSRYLISYQFLMFFVLLFFISLLYLIEKRLRRYFYLAIIAAALAILTNEAFFAILSVFIGFAFFCYLFQGDRSEPYLVLKRLIKTLKKRDYVFGLLLFILVIVTFQTAFFSNMSNMGEFFVTFFANTEKSYDTGHNKPFLYYAKLLIKFEFPLLLFLIFGTISLRPRFFDRFILFWSVSGFFLFSMIPYKTPWVFIIPIFSLFLLVGNGISVCADFFSKDIKEYHGKFLGIFSGKNGIKIRKSMEILYYLSISLLLIFSFTTAIFVNFVYQDDESINKLAYVQQTPELIGLIRAVNDYADKLPVEKKKDIKILITTNSYWPIPFYIKDYSLWYMTEIEEIDFDKYGDYDVIIADEKQIRVSASDEGYSSKKYETRQNHHTTLLLKDNKIIDDDLKE